MRYGQSPIVSRHAVQQARERHCPCLNSRKIEEHLLRLALEGHRRPTGRHWIRRIHHLRPGATYIFCAADPDVVLVMRGRIVCTVLVREMSRGMPRHREQQQVVALGAYRRWRKPDLQRELDAYDEDMVAA